MARPPICTACDHCHRPLNRVDYICARPISDRVDQVNGDFADRADVPCVVERSGGKAWFGLGRTRCGPDGRFFVEEHRAPPAPSRTPAKLKAVK